MIKVLSALLGREKEGSLNASDSRPLLDLCEDAGLTLPYGCRAGSCGSCRVQVLEGESLLAEPGPVEKDTLGRCRDAADVRLTCRAKLSPAAIEGVLRLGSPPEVPPAPDDDGEFGHG